MTNIETVSLQCNTRTNIEYKNTTFKQKNSLDEISGEMKYMTISTIVTSC